MSFCLYNSLSCSLSLPPFTNSTKTHYIPPWKFIIFKQPRIYFPVKSSLQQEMVGSCSLSLPPFTNSTKTHYIPPWKFIIFKQPRIYFPVKSSLQQEMVGISEENKEKIETEEEEKPKYRWIEIGPNITESQKQAISQIPVKMTKRCRALVKQIICFNHQETVLSSLLTNWVKIMKPQRADWLVVLKELTRLNHPMLFEVIEWALLEESFEPNVRDYTKLIDAYAKKNRLQDAENAFEDMKRRGFTYDLVTLTTLVHMYSKNGNLKRAEETFEDMKLLGLPLDQRAYGSMIMAYIRAGKTELGESLLIEMEAQDICAGREVYKALLRAYSEVGDTKGAQRVFDAIQFAIISPDVRLCALLMNAYLVAGQSTGVRNVFENMRSAGLEPSDKCLALMLSAYEKENELKMAMDFLMDLEKDGIMVGQEASDVLVGWFRRLGVVGDIELVLREFAHQES